MRIKVLDRAEMTEAQGRVYDKAKAAGGIVGGPYQAYIRLPHLFEVMQAMRDAMMPDPLSRRERNYIDLAVARHWNARYPWFIQSREGLKVGITADAIVAINARETPDIADPRERACYAAAVELLTTQRLSDAGYKAAEAVLGEAGIVGVVAAVGNFTTTCLTASAFDLQPPADAPMPLLEEETK